jgi:hypothetical protein
MFAHEMPLPLAEIRFYDVIVFVHVAAVIVAFGATFGYAFFQAITERFNPRGIPVLWRAMDASGKYLVTPGAVVALAAGIYLVIDAWEFGDLFVTVGMVAIIILLGLSGAFFAPQGRRAMELAERDIAAGSAGEVTLSDEYWAVSKRIARVGTLAGVIILVATFFMVVKP